MPYPWTEGMLWVSGRRHIIFSVGFALQSLGSEDLQKGGNAAKQRSLLK
jgi:hypothetical protein